MIETATLSQADYLTTAFARLGQLAPDPTDIYLGLSFRMAGPAPALDELLVRVAARVHHLPQLRERLVAEEEVRWAPDPDFDPANHVRALPPHEGVLSAQAVLGGRLDPARPPWSLWVAPCGADGWRLYYFVHHARQDAGAAVRTVLSLLGEPDQVPGPEAPRRGTARGRTGVLALTPDLIGSYLPTPAPAPVSYGPGRVLARESVPLSWLTGLARRTGATVNNVHLAAMSAALEDWLPTAARCPRPQFLVPLDTRRPGETGDDFTVRLGLMRVPLPTVREEPGDRVREMSALVSRCRVARNRRGWRDLAEHASPETAGWVMRRITAPTRIEVTLSSIRVDEPQRLLGAPVREITAIPWLPPIHQCFALLVTYGGQARLSVLSPEGAPDPAHLVARWREAVAELHHCATG